MTAAVSEGGVVATLRELGAEVFEELSFFPLVARPGEVAKLPGEITVAGENQVEHGSPEIAFRPSVLVELEMAASSADIVRRYSERGTIRANVISAEV